MEERLLEIFKQKHSQGDSYYCGANNKGDKFIVGYKNDYPMQHGDGVEWKIPVEVVEMLVSQVGHEPLGMFRKDRTLEDINKILAKYRKRFDEYEGWYLENKAEKATSEVFINCSRLLNEIMSDLATIKATAEIKPTGE